MHVPTVLYVLGRLFIIAGGLLLLPLIVAIVYHDPDHAEPLAFGLTMVIALGVGYVLRRYHTPDPNRFGTREGFGIVTFGWISMAFIGALPFMLVQQHPLSFTDAYFESMSGFTTTGSTILTDIEVYGRGLLFWRSLIQWLGGMGIVVLTVALLPSLGAGGYQLVRAEVPGPTADRIVPRIAQTAKILWSVYLIFTVAEILLLWAPSWFVAEGTAVGVPGSPYMDLYEAVCHTFTTLATGGFSTRNASIADYAPYLQYVIILFMVLAGTNFLLHWQLLLGRPGYMFKNAEWRFYAGIIGVVTLGVFAAVMWLPIDPQNGHGDDRIPQTAPEAPDDWDDDWKASPQKYDTTEETFRHSLFQVVSMVTTTGYATADFDRWPDVTRVALSLLMILGGCAGSTGGGLKMMRVLLSVRFAWREVKHVVHPHEVMPIKLGGRVVDSEVMRAILGTFILYMVLALIGMLALAAMPGFDLVTAGGATLATIGNIGPGLGLVGAVQNFAWMPAAAKWICAALMLLGRLEIFSVLVLLTPHFYRR